MLIVFDYVEQHVDPLLKLLSLASSKRDGQPLRFAFVSRQLDRRYERLKTEFIDTARLLYGIGLRLLLTSLGESLAHRRRLFESATQAFANHLGVPNLPPNPPDLTDEIFGCPLLIHMAALTSIWGEVKNTREELLKFLRGHEWRYWESVDKSLSLHSDHRLQSIQQLVVINTLLDSLPVNKRLRSIPKESLISEDALREVLKLDRFELRDIIGVVSNCYAVSDRIDPLRPDMLGEWIVVDELRENEGLLLSLVEVLNNDAIRPIFKVLNRITAQTEYRPEGTTWIKRSSRQISLASLILRFPSLEK